MGSDKDKSGGKHSDGLGGARGDRRQPKIQTDGAKPPKPPRGKKK